MEFLIINNEYKEWIEERNILCNKKGDICQLREMVKKGDIYRIFVLYYRFHRHCEVQGELFPRARYIQITNQTHFSQWKRKWRYAWHEIITHIFLFPFLYDCAGSNFSCFQKIEPFCSLYSSEPCTITFNTKWHKFTTCYCY